MTKLKAIVLISIMGVVSFSLTGADNVTSNPLNKVSSKSSNVDKYSPSRHFVWGFEVGTSIDITGYDSSTVNADALIGYRNALIDFLGAGIGFHRAMGSGDNYVPVYLTFRTSFTREPKPLFLSLKGGYSFNTIGDTNTFGDVNASIGMGINLARSRNFRSYLILAYEFRHFNEKHRDAVSIEDPNISMASLTLGFNF